MKTTTTERLPREAPMLHYRATSQPAVAAEAAPSQESLPAVLMWLSRGVFGVVQIVWAVIGAIVWLPLLIRAMLRFSLALVHATLVGEPPSAAAATLRGAVDFYRRGFIMAADALHGRTPETSGRHEPVGTRRLAWELAWVVLVWYVILAALGVLWSPVEFAAWILAMPWNDWAVGLGAWIVEPFA